MKQFIKNTILLLLGVLFFGWLFSVPVNKIGSDYPYSSPVDENHTFDTQELNDFMLLWNKANNSYIKNYMGSPSLRRDNKTSWFFKQWLRLHNWNAERFFYCEQRLHSLIKCHALRQNYLDNIRINKHDNIPLKNIINFQKRQLNECQFDDKEYELISQNLNNIMQQLPSNF